jgi:hypothetical protein
MGYRTVTVDVDVDLELDDFSDEDLIDELRDRGYTAKKNNSEFSWLTPSIAEDDLADVLWKLRQSYLIDRDDRFRKSFEKILAEYGYYV